MVPHKLLHVMCIFSLVIIAPGKEDIISLSLSNNPVYTGQQVEILCSLQRVLLLTVTIDGFNGTRKEGSLSCSNADGNQTATGIFSRHLLQGCPGGHNRSINHTVTITASTTTALDFRCTATVVNGNNNLINITTSNASLEVRTLPTVPRIAPKPTAFNDSEKATIQCESRGGTPASILELAVFSPIGYESKTYGNESISLTLPPPLVNWHNATVTCTVTNHKFPNMSEASIISINHIFCTNETKLIRGHAISGKLNCFNYISGYPITNYSWSVPPDITVTNLSSLTAPSFSLGHFDSGTFSCTVTNSAINKTATVVFELDNAQALSNSSYDIAYTSRCYPASAANKKSLPTVHTVVLPSHGPAASYVYWMVPSIIGGIAVVIVVMTMFIAYWRRRRSHMGDEIEMIDNDLYDSHKNDQTIHSVASLANSHISYSRLLMVPEGFSDNVSFLILQSTIVMEYSMGDYALDDILAELRNRDTQKFRSLALLLPSPENDVEKHQEDEKTLSIDNEAFKQQRMIESFFCLVDMCLDRHAHDSGIDIFNYCGTDAAGLASTIRNILKVPVTVSACCGFGDSQSVNTLHASLGAKYFNFSRASGTYHTAGIKSTERHFLE